MENSSLFEKFSSFDNLSWPTSLSLPTNFSLPTYDETVGYVNGAIECVPSSVKVALYVAAGGYFLKHLWESIQDKNHVRRLEEQFHGVTAALLGAGIFCTFLAGIACVELIKTSLFAAFVGTALAVTVVWLAVGVAVATNQWNYELCPKRTASTGQFLFFGKV